MIKDDNVRFVTHDRCGNLVCLARADKVFGVRLVPSARNDVKLIRSCRMHQQAKLF